MEYCRMLEYLLTHHRWIFVCVFLLPISLVYKVFFYIRNKIIFWLASAPKLHNKRVRAIQQQVRACRAGTTEQAQTYMCTGRPGWLTTCIKVGIYKETYHKIDINLCDILSIDEDRQVVHVEPLVSMGQLTSALNPLGWTLPVVPELDDLTVGGLIMGCGIETSSHKYGLFQHICVSYELVLGDGTLTTCNKDDNPDLYYAIPWSHGTLGFLVSAEIRIVKASQFVKLDYIPIWSKDELVKRFQEESKERHNDFVECLVFSNSAGVIMTGRYTDGTEPNKVNVISRYWKPWFFTHVRKCLSTGELTTEYIPLRDYYHRHTKSLFWELQDIIPFGNNCIFRYLFGWLVPPPISLLKLTQTKTTKRLYELHHVVQDILLPINKLNEALSMLDKEVKLYPLWLCPFKLISNPGFVHPGKDEDEMYVDIGIYGNPQVKPFIAKDCIRNIEQFSREVHGFQMLYGDTYMTREEFHKMFDHKLYNEVRKNLECDKVFPEVYDKVCKAARK